MQNWDLTHKLHQQNNPTEKPRNTNKSKPSQSGGHRKSKPCKTWWQTGSFFCCPVKPAPPVNLSHVQTIEAELILHWTDPNFQTGVRYEVRYSPETTHPAWQVTVTPTGELMEPCESHPPPTGFRFRVFRSCPCLEKPGRLWTWSPEWTTPSKCAAPASMTLRCGAAGVKVTTSSWTVRSVFSALFPEPEGLLVRTFEQSSCTNICAILHLPVCKQTSQCSETRTVLGFTGKVPRNSHCEQVIIIPDVETWFFWSIRVILRIRILSSASFPDFST